MRALEKSGWEVWAAADVTLSSNLIREHGITLGLVYLEDADEPLPELEELILKHATMEWIALVSPAALERPSVRKIVAEAFHDYHTLPVDQSRHCI